MSIWWHHPTCNSTTACLITHKSCTQTYANKMRQVFVWAFERKTTPHIQWLHSAQWLLDRTTHLLSSRCDTCCRRVVHSSETPYPTTLVVVPYPNWCMYMSSIVKHIIVCEYSTVKKSCGTTLPNELFPEQNHKVWQQQRIIGSMIENLMASACLWLHNSSRHRSTAMTSH